MSKSLTRYEKSSLDKISHLVALYNDIDQEDLFSGSNDDKCLMRYMVYFIAHWQFKIPIGSLKRYFKHKQHGTVINGLKRIDQWRQTDKQIKEALDTLVRSLDNVPIRKSQRQLTLSIHHAKDQSDGNTKEETN